MNIPKNILLNSNVLAALDFCFKKGKGRDVFMKEDFSSHRVMYATPFQLTYLQLVSLQHPSTSDQSLAYTEETSCTQGPRHWPVPPVQHGLHAVGHIRLVLGVWLPLPPHGNVHI